MRPSRQGRCAHLTGSRGLTGNAAGRADATRSVEDLRHLGPELKPDQILLTVDEILTRKSKPHRFWELRTARIVTADG